MVTPVSYPFEPVIAASKQLPYQVLLDALSFLLEEQISAQRKLRRGEQRKAKAKSQVPGFVMKDKHPDGSAHGAAEQGKDEERPFADAPPSPPGPVLVKTHHTKEEGAHHSQKNRQILPQRGGERRHLSPPPARRNTSRTRRCA